jgi:hypothetical protein
MFNVTLHKETLLFGILHTRQTTFVHLKFTNHSADTLYMHFTYIILQYSTDNTEQSTLPYILDTEKMQMLSLDQPTFSLEHSDNSGNETHDHILTATQNKEPQHTTVSTHP